MILTSSQLLMIVLLYLPFLAVDAYRERTSSLTEHSVTKHMPALSIT